MERCFVIQPFDKDRFDQRFADTYAPAISTAGLEPYRIDSDPGVRIPIEDIEKGIANSAICFADITIDNPNVWYELGFAFACGKDVVMVCSDERAGSFPFDIRHKTIINYKTRSVSDFQALSVAITNRITALLNQSKKVKSLHTVQASNSDGLGGHEIAAILIIAENQFTSLDTMSVYNLKIKMEQAKYDGFATGIALKTLESKQLVATSEESDYNSQGELYMVCKLTDIGIKWVLSNASKYIKQPES
ncbi:hypothetical protein [Mucilaginibacter sp. CSA2-8R]|uniref:hypothetical protein n=1 Tax=Mucilaginibacter sp. CSA2-8R TaxID=3141542 RepID=UPI00315D66AE